jgi:Transposase DDE domain
VEDALGRWVRGRLGPGRDRISIDGKTLRGSRDGALPGQHLVAAYAPEAEAVLAQLRVDAKTNEHKAALQLLGILPLQGKVVVGDALFCQRDVAAQVVDQGGAYLFVVKDNQPGLATDVSAGFGFEAAARSIAAAFSPGAAAPAAGAGGHDGRQGARAAGEADLADHQHPHAAPPVAGPGAGL